MSRRPEDAKKCLCESLRWPFLSDRRAAINNELLISAGRARPRLAKLIDLHLARKLINKSCSVEREMAPATIM